MTGDGAGDVLASAMLLKVTHPRKTTSTHISVFWAGAHTKVLPGSWLGPG
jgi:hypothetical protein